MEKSGRRMDAIRIKRRCSIARLNYSIGCKGLIVDFVKKGDCLLLNLNAKGSVLEVGEWNRAWAEP
jgi:hypothetical protein